jgi:hypothetical protein
VLRLLGYALLSIGLAFVGAAALMQQRLQEELFGAWTKLPSQSVSLEVLRNPIAQALPLNLSFYEIGIAIAWITGLGMYLGLGYMTFIYRWNTASSTMD